MKRDISDLLRIMAQLRDREQGCPWDIEQDFASIAPYTIEEAYEVADAIDRGDFPALRDELGDLLLQVVFHARMAEEAGHFDFGEVVAAICDKMWRRHPHVFGEASVPDAAAQTELWEAIKRRERGDAGDASALAGVARGLPEWQRALKLQLRAAHTGFDWPDAHAVLDKLREEIGEVAAEVDAGEAPGSQRLLDEVGDLLFVAVNLARKTGVDVSAALRHANRKFERRFRAMEALADEEGRPLAERSLEDQEALWQRIKR
ncbi:nucleoside triphosphate pyrophosphohydrolase [Pseudofulvimonas gallinarii]|uniref:ATP diphosphatase n=1 Tax=Pseudofulvimonas gallinarii TaxID=634155 RepID=A0A4S3KYQ9_9GAMM|nr:nucleoside triphosphate pyrophosphohydrolase [Pseudofulvimonas gallinarii]TCS94502.1 ATP diphosphatase [Pseudofulvimonas gallinarii]THD14545.1 nucleoside triphosphate pyrophosphohydrolase [Pseudofulvimonas gallinarii]